MVLSGRWGHVHYFGLVPAYYVTDPPQIQEGYLAFLFVIFNALLHPFTMFYTLPEDRTGYVETIQQMLVPDTTASGDFDGLKVFQGAVCEPFSHAACDAGANKDPDQWVADVSALEPIGSYIFS